MVPSQDRLVEAFNPMERHVEERYGIPVMISDVLDPNTGDFNGVEIKIDYANDIEAPLQPIPVPVFRATKWVSRWSS